LTWTDKKKEMLKSTLRASVKRINLKIIKSDKFDFKKLKNY